MKVQEQVALAPLTTLGVGGPARFFVKANSQQDALDAVAYARQKGLPVFVLGGGSNLVIADSGFNGLVLQIDLLGKAVCNLEHGRVLLQAEAGENWDGFVEFSVQQQYAGLECLSGIPGTVGGAPVQNVGAYGQEVSETIQRVEAIDMRTGELRSFTNADCGFAYRSSIFNTTQAGCYIILRMAFVLRRNGEPRISYADLKQHFPPSKHPPSLADVRKTVLQIRRSKGMVLDQGDPDSRSAGSFFKNPVLSDKQFRDLEMRAGKRGLRVPNYPALSSQRKVSAAWLVEQAGFGKGTNRGRVGISSKHSLAIINRGGATAAEVVALMREIQYAVRDQFGIELRPEPVFLGFD